MIEETLPIDEVDNFLKNSQSSKPLPRKGRFGVQFTRASFSIQIDRHQHHTLPPVAPTQNWVEYDDNDCVIASGRYTDEEYANHMASFREAAQKYRECGGIHYSHGRTNVTATLYGDRSNWAVVIMNNDGDWIILEESPFP